MDTDESISLLRDRISGWLTVTRDAEIRVGLEAEETAVRVQALLGAIRKGSAEPERVSVDDELKQVLSAVVSLLEASREDPESRLKEADAVYRFIERLPWPDDPLGEKRDLLLECAEIGWGAIGLDFAKVDRRRRAFEGGGTSHDFRSDPNESSEALRSTARAFLKLPLSLRSDDEKDRALGDPDTLAFLFEVLIDQIETCPSMVAEEASSIHAWLKAATRPIGVFDERDYFIGEAAFMAGNCRRLLGRREEAARWLERAELSFRRTINPAPSLARIAYARLGLRFEMGRHDEVLDLLPSVRREFDRLGMVRESAKCRLVEAMALKGQGNFSEALRVLEPIGGWAKETLGAALKGRVLAEIGDLYQCDNQLDSAMIRYREAFALLSSSGDSQASLADLKLFVGDVYRRRDQFEAALGAFRSAVADYLELRMSTRVAYVRVIMAETLLRLSRFHEAEQEILAALPTIEEQKMVPEGFAAVALLKESVRRRKTDPNALRELREHLQAANQK